ncbi:bactofilin family protein [Eleftheria terrae]|uniref:bactofilin family protein n=1 Tax=Eleftheria terrae TaxID=1597781 RepID=UPI00263B4FD3|nr:polymer-forming cytoskeletal protein [Eleftheria terrae]WKB53347.1 polymer-forming cytoskeletal protein [Eleftheria terrae]
MSPNTHEEEHRATPAGRHRPPWQAGAAAGLALGMWLAGFGCWAASDDGLAPVLEGSPPNDVYAAAARVRLSQAVAGDAFLAGASVRIDEPVSGDAAIAAAELQAGAAVGRDLRVAAGRAYIDSRIGGDAHLVAGQVALGPGTEVGGRTWLTAGEVLLGGKLGGDVKIYAGTVRIGGDIAGDVHVTARRVRVLPGARIGGSLSYASAREIEVDPGAQVRGRTVREPGGLPGGDPTAPGLPGLLAALAWLGWLLGLVILGTGWVLLFPQAAHAAQQRLLQSPWRSLLLGAVLFCATPVLAVLLMASIVGAPLALVLLAAYLLALLAGYLVVAGLLGDHIAQALRQGGALTPPWRIAGLALALLLLALVTWLPVLGGLTALLALMWGLGGLAARYAPRPA